ncbi:MAG: hypothetical protein HY674_08255 [Chloroflexi bacterium]|nr:hypothetical protein [Chloroflexota bacterium]
MLLAEGVAILAFYGLEWAWLRQMHVLWLQTTLQALGYHVETAGTLLTVEGQRFQIDPDCTYVDLILCALPLLWRVRRRLFANLAALAGFAGAVVVVNLARVLSGVYALAQGVSLFWAHDVVDYVLWYPTLGVVAWSWAQSLRTLWPETTEEPCRSRREEAHSEIRNTKLESGNSQSLLTSAATTFGQEATSP